MRKGWDNLSPAYRHRLERSGITRRLYERGEPITRARGHFTSPLKRPGIFRREKLKSEVWNTYRHRVRRLAAGESIRRAFLIDGTIGYRGSILRQTVEFYEGLEAQYADEGDGGAEYQGEWSDWYSEMVDEWYESGEFVYPELDVYYHGNRKG